MGRISSRLDLIERARQVLDSGKLSIKWRHVVRCLQTADLGFWGRLHEQTQNSTSELEASPSIFIASTRERSRYRSITSSLSCMKASACRNIIVMCCGKGLHLTQWDLKDQKKSSDAKRK